MTQIQNLINYQTLGSDTSPKLVFLHGIMGQGRNWLSIAKKFSKSYQCLVLDQRGHGQSFHPEKGFALADYAKDLIDLIEHLGWQEPIYLIGHSMGGRVALKVAEEYPSRIEKLVIVDIGASSDWSSMEAILQKLDFVPVPFESREKCRQFFENQFMQKYNNSMLMEFLYSNMTDRNGQYDWTFSKPLIRKTLESSRHRDHWDAFKQLKMPTLLIRGENSTDLKRDEFQKLLANNSNIKGQEVAGAGHWVHAEKPRETIRIIEEFFNIATGEKG